MNHVRIGIGAPLSHLSFSLLCNRQGSRLTLPYDPIDQNPLPSHPLFTFSFHFFSSLLKMSHNLNDGGFFLLLQFLIDDYITAKSFDMKCPLLNINNCHDVV
ncbi:hypothetical protein VNO77_04187 [Canavalia gladiata]|uniref:Uncharacterized protein n=1 Tax=Canavalia gladiata TaxID=3824 RepID=A0AAN9R7J4_CANGL